jgi:7-cyano-7-deazaguanine reductase
MPTEPKTALETFANPAPEHDYTVELEIPEFTCLCPKTGQPDFATLELEYVPDRLCVELKSLKLYVWSFRNRGAFHEAVTNEIADHVTAAIEPRYLRLAALFNVRGGISTRVVTERRQPRWAGEAP